MEIENEITVKVNISKKELLKFLKNNNYKKIDSFIMDDIYYVEKDKDLDVNPLEILKKYILIRSINNKKHYLMYKYKEYDENENIINQGKSKVQVTNKKAAEKFLNIVGYKELIKVNDYIEIYEKDELQICVQYVNRKYLFIEIEENEKYDSIKKLIEILDKTKINYDKSNYFVNKAKVIFEEKYRNEI